MKRFTFLLTALLTVAVSVFAGVVPVTVAPRLVVAAPESPPENPSAEADWETMSAGALMATRFQSEDEVTDYINAGTGSGNISWDTYHKTVGNGSLRLFFPKETGQNPGSWWRHLNDAWGVGDHDGGTDTATDIGFNEGTTFEVYFRVRIPRRFVDTVLSPGDGSKLAIISHDGRSNQSFEIVTQDIGYRGFLRGYTQNPPNVTHWNISASTSCSGSDFRFQPAIDRGANPLPGVNPDDGSAWTACEQDLARYGGLYSYGQSGYPDSLGTSRQWRFWEQLSPTNEYGPITWPADDWIAIKYTVDLVSYSEATNRVRVYAGKRWDDDWILVADLQNVLLPDSEDPRGNDFRVRYNALWFTLWDTNRTGSDFDFSVHVGDAIVKEGAGSIPFPQWWPDNDYESVLLTYAQMLDPGESIKLPTSGLTWSLVNQSNEDIIQWGGSAYWCQEAKEFGFIGKRQSSSYPYVWLTYDATSDTWSNTREPWTTSNSSGHGYDHNTVDPETCDVYHKPYGSYGSSATGRTLRKWTRATQSWSSLPVAPEPNISAATITWWPGLGLISADRRYINRYDSTAGAWEELHDFGAPVAPDDDDLSSVSEYNPVANAMLLGGGDESVDMFRLNADLTVDAIETPPYRLGVGNSQGVLCSDPVSERMIAHQKQSTNWHYYSFRADDWTALTQSSGNGSTPQSGTPNITDSQGSVICAPVTFDTPNGRVGVTMWLNVATDGNAPEVWLYRMPTAANDDEFTSILEDAFDSARMAA